MKKIIILLALFVAVLIYNEIKEQEIIIPSTAIRLRVIPNSNSTRDQNIKNMVKEHLEKNTYELLQGNNSIEEARQIIINNIPVLENEINEIFKENNYNKNFEINYGENYFPKKEYRGIKYEEGYYESIVISIGNAEGDNWWCVLFPNLCLIDLQTKEEKEYKSWIAEAINKII